MLDSRRATVRADSPAPPSEMRTTLASVLGERWAATKSTTSRLVTAAGSFCAQLKNTFKSNAAASTELGLARPDRNVRYSSTRSCPTLTNTSPEGAWDCSTDSSKDIG